MTVGAIIRKVVIMSPMKVLNVSSPLTLAHIQSKKIKLNSLPISIFSDTTASGEVQTLNESDRISNAGLAARVGLMPSTRQPYVVRKRRSI